MNPRPEHVTPSLPAMREASHPGALVASANAPGPPAAPLDVLALMKALRRRLPLAIGLGVVLAAVAAGVTYAVVPPAKYTARAMLHASTETPRILVKTAENQSSFETFQRTQMAMLRSRLVLNAALSVPEVAKLPVVRKQADPIEWLEKELQIDFANGSEILRISMSGLDAREPTVLVNEVVKAYISLVVNADIERRKDRADMLKQTWDRYQGNLRGKREELKRLSMAAGSDDKETQAILQRSEAERLSEAEQLLSQTRAEMRKLRVEHDISRRRLAAEPAASAADIEAEVARDPEVQRFAEQMDRALSSHDSVARLARKGEDPALKRHREDYQAARAGLAARRKQIAPIIAEQLRRQSNSGSKSEAFAERIEVLAGLERLQSDDVARLSKRGRTMTEASNDLTALRQEIIYADELAQKMGAEVEALNLELLAPPRVTRREEAQVPKTKDELRQAKMAAMAGFGAFGLALFGVAFFESRARRVDSVEEVVRGLHVHLVGTLPALPRRSRLRNPSGGSAAAWQAVMVESVDAARAMLLHASRRDSVRAVMVASALGGEGKTSLSCHLAASLARAGLRTLLIDCDLRRPSVHRLFDLPNGPGVCEILRAEADPETSVQTTESPGLSVLPAGRCDAEAIRCLARGDLGVLLARFRAEYDFLIVDSSPVLPVADALQVAQHVDGVLYSVLRDVSRMPAMQAAHERLAAVGIRPLGAIVSGTASDFYGHQYYSYASSRSSESA